MFPAFDFRNTVYVIMINLTLALAAFGKDVFLAAYLGTSSEADVFLLSYFVVDTIGNNLIATALGVACLPVFAQWHVHSERQLFIQTVRSTVFFSLILTGFLALLMWVERGLILTMFGGKWPHSILELGMLVFSIILPALIIFPLLAIGTSILQVYSKFIIPALAPVLFNLVFFVSLKMGLLLFFL